MKDEGGRRGMENASRVGGVGGEGDCSRTNLTPPTRHPCPDRSPLLLPLLLHPSSFILHPPLLTSGPRRRITRLACPSAGPT